MTSKQSPNHTLFRVLNLFFRMPIRLVSNLILVGTQVWLTLIIPVLLGRAIDSILLKQYQELGSSLLLMGGAVMVNTLVQWLSPLLFHRMIYQVMAQIRQQIFEQLQGLPLVYLDRQQIGDIVARMSSDSEQLSDGLLMLFNQFFIGLLTIMCTIVTMLQLDIGMLVVVICLTPLSLFVARWIAKKSYFLYQQQARLRGEQLAFLEESISALPLVQLFQTQGEMVQTFREKNQSYTKYSQFAIFMSSTTNPATRAINAIIYALLTGLGAFRIIQGNLTVGELTIFLNYASQYTKPFNDISSVLSELQSALASAERIFEMIDEPVATEVSTLTLTEPIRGEVTFCDVAFSYQAGTPLLSQFNLSISAGSKVAIVGETGAGKSTLINLLMRFYDVQEGDILLDGQSIYQISKRSLRSQIGLVLQDTWLKTGSIHDNIAYGSPDASRHHVIEAAKAAKADFFIQQLPRGYDTVLGENSQLLSQGQQQLIAISRMFLKPPRILLLDEATSSVDTRTERLIQQAFERLMTGRTSFVIAHRLSTIESADKILVMADGNIVEQGTHQELMQKKGLYYKMREDKEQ